MRTVCFCLMLLLTAVPAQAALPGDVVINEVAWAGTAASANDEWIELHNPTGQPVELTGWTLTAADGSPSIALSGTLPAGGFFLLERTDDATVSDIAADLIYTGSLSNTGEALFLRDGQGALIDSANGDGGPWPAGDNVTKATMERIDPSAPDSDANWASHTGTLQRGRDAAGTPLAATARAQNAATNHPPACANAALSTPAGAALDIDLASLCSDLDGDALSFTTLSGPSSGTLACAGAGGAACTYTPNAKFTGTDQFTFQAQDPLGNSAAAQVTVQVEPAGTMPSVVFVSGSGSDANDGLTAQAPLATLQTAIDRVAPGGRVVVLTGVFQAALQIDKPLRLEATGAVTLSAGAEAAITVSASDVTVEGLSIVKAAIGVRVLAGAANVRLTHNALVGNATGLENLSASPVQASDNWWGCNAGPGQPGCDTASGSVQTAPWLVTTLEANPVVVELPGSTTLTLGLTQNSSGAGVTHPLSRPATLKTNAGGFALTPDAAGWNWVWPFSALAAGGWCLRRRRRPLLTLASLALALALGGCHGNSHGGQTLSAALSLPLQQGVLTLQLVAQAPGEVTVTAGVDGQTLQRRVQFLSREAGFEGPTSMQRFFAPLATPRATPRETNRHGG